MENLTESLKNIWILAKKELRLLVYSPVIYVVGVFFLLIVGWFSMLSFFSAGLMNLQGFFELLPFVFSFVVPALTMRSFSEEYSSGSFELLMSLPLSKVEIIAGKFLANFLFALLLVVPTVLYPISLSLLGSFYALPLMTSYFGILFLLGLFVSIGIAASSLTKNQIIAWVLGFCFCFVLTVIDSVVFYLPSALLDFFRYVSVRAHFESFSFGVLDFRDLLYFVSFGFIFNYATYVIIDSKSR